MKHTVPGRNLQIFSYYIKFENSVTKMLRNYKGTTVTLLFHTIITHTCDLSQSGVKVPIWRLHL